MAAPDHAFIMNYIATDDFGHHGQIEVADFRIAFRETVKYTIGCLNRGQYLSCPVPSGYLVVDLLKKESHMP